MRRALADSKVATIEFNCYLLFIKELMKLPKEVKEKFSIDLENLKEQVTEATNMIVDQTTLLENEKNLEKIKTIIRIIADKRHVIYRQIIEILLCKVLQQLIQQINTNRSQGNSENINFIIISEHDITIIKKNFAGFISNLTQFKKQMESSEGITDFRLNKIKDLHKEAFTDLSALKFNQIKEIRKETFTKIIDIIQDQVKGILNDQTIDLTTIMNNYGCQLMTTFTVVVALVKICFKVHYMKLIELEKASFPHLYLEESNKIKDKLVNKTFREAIAANYEKNGMDIERLIPSEKDKLIQENKNFLDEVTQKIDKYNNFTLFIANNSTIYSAKNLLSNDQPYENKLEKNDTLLLQTLHNIMVDIGENYYCEFISCQKALILLPTMIKENAKLLPEYINNPQDKTVASTMEKIVQRSKEYEEIKIKSDKSYKDLMKLDEKAAACVSQLSNSIDINKLLNLCGLSKEYLTSFHLLNTTFTQFKQACQNFRNKNNVGNNNNENNNVLIN